MMLNERRKKSKSEPRPEWKPRSPKDSSIMFQKRLLGSRMIQRPTYNLAHNPVVGDCSELNEPEVAWLYLDDPA
jgi:hypothetical protein